MQKSRILSCAVLLTFVLFSTPATASKEFLESGDASEEGEPRDFLPHYERLVKGKHADWVYLPSGALNKSTTLAVKEFTSNAKGENRIDGRHAAEWAKDYLEMQLEEEGFRVVPLDENPEVIVEGNVFNAWEPNSTVYNAWFRWTGCGSEIIARNRDGGLLAEIRDRKGGTTIRDAVENGMENIAKTLKKGK